MIAMKVIITKGGLGLGSLASLVTLAFVIAKLASFLLSGISSNTQTKKGEM